MAVSKTAVNKNFQKHDFKNGFFVGLTIAGSGSYLVAFVKPVTSRTIELPPTANEKVAAIFWP